MSNAAETADKELEAEVELSYKGFQWSSSEDEDEATATAVSKKQCLKGLVNGIRTSDGKEPRFWVVEKNAVGKPSYATNVVNVSWGTRDTTWLVGRVVNGRMARMPSPNGTHSVFKHKTIEAAFASACEARRGVVDTYEVEPSRLIIQEKTNALVVTECTNSGCNRKNRCISEFVPDPRVKRDAFNAFELAIDTVRCVDCTTDEFDAAMKVLDTERTSTCMRCRQKITRSRHEGAHSEGAECFAMTKTIRDDLAKRKCTRCGLFSKAMQCEHPGRENKIFALSSPWQWSGHGGADAMWQNYKTIVPMCSFCHRLEDTHNLHYGVDSAAMPTATHQQRINQLNRRYREEKMKINNAWKREEGECYHCARVVKPGEEHAFEWMHSQRKMVTLRGQLGLPPLTKSFTISVAQAMCGSPETFVRRVKPEIEEKCELGCSNCHHIHETIPENEETYGRMDRFVERVCSLGGVVVPC